MDGQIYLDYHATTPCDPAVINAMLPFFGVHFGNPSSSVHRTGKIAASAVENARTQVANLIDAHPREIIFTSGATESNNLALLGLAREKHTERRQIITTAIEHKSVLAPCKHLQKLGCDVTVLPVNQEGVCEPQRVSEILSDKTLLISIQAANNEIGTIQSIAEIAAIAHEHGAYVHCDAAQAVGKIPIDVDEWDVDLLSISAHKLYGPKGIGALYVRGGVSSLPIQPLAFGGGQEFELRPGTLNVPAIVGFGEACFLCQQLLPSESKRIATLRDRLEQLLLESELGIKQNGALARRLPGNSSFTFPQVDAEALIANLPEFALSTSSACTSGAPEPSHVLLAIGLSREEANNSMRVGIGRFTTMEEMNKAAGAISDAYTRLLELGAQILP